MLLPLFVLLVLPGLILASSGRINPVWGWNRLAFQVPDATWAMLVMALALLFTGVVKTRVFLQSTWLRRTNRSLQTASLKP
jgi:TRAP-type C4-dicarboxylate transport system permease small subunit